MILGTFKFRLRLFFCFFFRSCFMLHIDYYCLLVWFSFFNQRTRSIYDLWTIDTCLVPTIDLSCEKHLEVVKRHSINADRCRYFYDSFIHKLYFHRKMCISDTKQIFCRLPATASLKVHVHHNQNTIAVLIFFIYYMRGSRGNGVLPPPTRQATLTPSLFFWWWWSISTCINEKENMI